VLARLKAGDHGQGSDPHGCVESKRLIKEELDGKRRISRGAATEATSCTWKRSSTPSDRGPCGEVDESICKLTD